MLNNFSSVAQTGARASSGGIYSGECLPRKAENKVLKQTLRVGFPLVCHPLQPRGLNTKQVFNEFLFFGYYFYCIKERWKKLKQFFGVASRMKPCVLSIELLPAY